MTNMPFYQTFGSLLFKIYQKNYPISYVTSQQYAWAKSDRVAVICICTDSGGAERR